MPAPTTPGEAFATRLLSADAAAFKALIGGNRLYPSKPSQDPVGGYAIYYKSAGGEGTGLGGRNKLQQYSMRLDCYAATEAEAEAILAAAVAVLAGDPPWVDKANGVHGCFTQNDADELVDNTDGGGRQVSGQTFSLWYKG